MHTGLYVRFELGTVLLVGHSLFPEAEALEEIVAVYGGLCPDKKQETAYFWLEDDDEEYESYGYKLPKYGGCEPHTEERRDLPEYINDDQCPKNAKHVGAADGFVNLVSKKGDKKDVDNVYKCYCGETLHFFKV